MKNIWGQRLFKNYLLFSVLLLLGTKSFASTPWINSQWIGVNSYEVRILRVQGAVITPKI